jgi:hypothetical protein
MLPNSDDLFAFGQIYGGDKGVTPSGKSYWKFIVITYKSQTYVLENHIANENNKWTINTIVKKLI